MRINSILITTSLLLFISACKKSQSPSGKPPEETDLVDQAHAFFVADTNRLKPIIDANPRISTPKTVNWDQAKVIDLSRGKAVLVPIKYERDLFIRTTQGGKNNFHLSNLAQLLVYQANGVFHTEIVTGLPDTNYLKYPQGAFSGLVYVEDWAGNSLAKYLYDGKQVFKYTPHSPLRVQSLSVAPIEVCYELTGYNYSLAAPDGGYAWAEAPVCVSSMVPLDDPMDGYPEPGGTDYGNVAGNGGASSGSSSYAPYVPPPNSIIQDVNNYFKCFTNVGGTDHQYIVTVCVDQPESGSRTPWTLTSGGINSSIQAGNAVDVGHTFLMLTETYGNTNITRNIGFYPSIFVQQLSPSAQGVMNDDEQHQYNISASFNVTNADFFSILNYISQQNVPGYKYNLNYNNCTTFALHALAQGGINLPNTVGSWPGGMGNDPGDLGEDLRSNNIPGMTLNTGIITDLSHSNVGQCN